MPVDVTVLKALVGDDEATISELCAQMEQAGKNGDTAANLSTGVELFFI